MIRSLNTILVAVSVAGLVAVYALKSQAEKTAGEIAALETTLARKSEYLSTLRADWAYLNQPSTLEPIIARHAAELGLAASAAEQFSSLDSIPMRPPAEPNSAALEALLLSLEAGVDPSIGPDIGAGP
jgi:hypothetical protein